jgi:hypothetical protein
MAMKIMTDYIETTHTDLWRLIKITHVPIWFLLILIVFSYACMMPRPRLIPCYYIYVDDCSNICIYQSAMVDMTHASPDLNPGTLFFSLMLSI